MWWVISRHFHSNNIESTGSENTIAVSVLVHEGRMHTEVYNLKKNKWKNFKVVFFKPDEYRQYEAKFFCDPVSKKCDLCICVK